MFSSPSKYLETLNGNKKKLNESWSILNLFLKLTSNNKNVCFINEKNKLSLINPRPVWFFSTISKYFDFLKFLEKSPSHNQRLLIQRLLKAQKRIIVNHFRNFFLTSCRYARFITLKTFQRHFFSNVSIAEIFKFLMLLKKPCILD